MRAMKRGRRRKVLERGKKAATVAIMSTVVLSRLATPFVVLADTVIDATSPQQGGPTPTPPAVERRSTGAMTVEGVGSDDPAIDFSSLTVIGDDLEHDSVLGRDVRPESLLPDPSINVWGSVIGDDDVVYHVEIHWGNMRFIYDFGAGWEPEILDYGDGDGGGWLVDNASLLPPTLPTLPPSEATIGFLRRLDGETIGNNEVRVTNRSNSAVSAGFSFVMAPGPMIGTGPATMASIFNADTTDPNYVVGGFYASEDDAQLAAATLRTATVGVPVMNAVIGNLPSAEGHGPVAPNAIIPESSPLVESRFFAFRGRPDAGVNTDFVQAGRIVINISPA